MPPTLVSRKQWQALRRIGRAKDDAPIFPGQPYPWGFHQGTWTSLERRRLITFSFGERNCYVELTDSGHDVVRQMMPFR